MATTELTRPPDDTKISGSSVAERFALPVEFTAGTARGAGLIWVATRAMMFVALGLFGGPVTGDVLYYARSLRGLFAGGSLRETLQEYPVPVLGIMLPQYLLGALNPVAFTCLFALSMLALDAAFTALVWRVTGRRGSEALTFWLWCLPAIGPIAYFRFDLVPGVLTGAALLAAVRRPIWTGVLTALGTALKLFPIVMLPVFLIRRASRRPVLHGFVAASAVVGLAGLVAGPSRLLSPLHWQGARGLQIESVPAMPLMLARSLDSHAWDVRTSQYKATEMFGPGVHALITLSTLATVAGLLALIVLWCRVAVRPVVPQATLGWLVLAAATVLTVVNKTLSPQYILWLGAPLAALIVASPRDLDVRRAARLLLMLSVATQLVYPTGYTWLVNIGWHTFPMTLLLAARNVLLIWLACLACAQVWKRTRPSPLDLDASAAQPERAVA